MSELWIWLSEGEADEGCVEQRIYGVGYVTCFSKGIAVAAVLNTDSGEPGKKQTNEGSVAIMQVKKDGGDNTSEEW